MPLITLSDFSTCYSIASLYILPVYMNKRGKKNMKKAIRKSITISSTLAAAVLLQLAIPTTVAAHGDFVTESNGNIVVDGYKECVSQGKTKHRPGVKSDHCVKAPKKAAAKPAPKPKPVVHENITLSAHALFDTNKNDLRSAGAAELDDVAAKLNSFHSINSITVTGHTDSRGAEGYNQALSERRAVAVKNYLVSKGINSNLIGTSGAGENSPVSSNDTVAGRQQNRRVEISIKAQK